MNEHYNQNYSLSDIISIMNDIQNCIREDNFIISKNKNRVENKDFINEYNLNNKRQKEILLKIQAEDFCHTLNNTNAGYEHEILYVFCPQVKLINFIGIEELIDMYVKFNLIDIVKERRLVVISFHKRNKAINYLFKH